MLHNCKVACVLPRIADCAKNDHNAVLRKVQSIARMCYTLFAKTCPERSHRLFSSFDPIIQRATRFSFSLGPPVFTSPVRPATMPFRTSPTTLQLVAFSLGSSLPTSSPLHFCNGSAELQHQVLDVIEETTPYGESSCVMFSAHKVPLFLSDSLQRHPYSS
ncbi:hypothetical protein Pint_31615 [Pistacia integerrima]|uniref:Uncharacterized protein n=1 Tax=Pistacia integerrima TaxID=434235 RepID=A0ACC0XRC2_9ROSI|nr:hypothetical protein Pint_31615 [Pistacia integerrima]